MNIKHECFLIHHLEMGGYFIIADSDKHILYSHFPEKKKIAEGAILPYLTKYKTVPLHNLQFSGKFLQRM